MPQFTMLTSRVVPLLVDNIDTDQIIPARFLKVTDKEGLGRVLFCDWRYQGTVPSVEAAEGAAPNPGFVLNDPRYAGAQVLVAGDNFGCGSSREHAPWALTAYGFRAVVSTSFADIFRSNALKNGLLPVEVDAQTHAALLALPPDAEITISLEARTLEVPGGGAAQPEARSTRATFPIDPFARQCLLRGVDQLGYLLSFDEAIRAYEEARGHVSTS